MMWLALLGLGCGPEPGLPSDVERPFTLIYSGNLDGEIEPCG
jgi:hypothetical protein